MRHFSLRSTLFTAALLAGTAIVSAAPLQVAIDTAPAGLDPHLITAFNSVLIVQGNVYGGLCCCVVDCNCIYICKYILNLKRSAEARKVYLLKKVHY